MSIDKFKMGVFFMNNFVNKLTLFFPILYWVYAFIAFLPIYDLVRDTIHIPIINFLISLIAASTPIVGTVMGVIGAVKLWDWELWQALLMYLFPYILIFIIMCIMFLSDKFKEKG